MTMPEKHVVSIDQEKCAGCGLCAEDCVSKNIEISGGKAQIKDFFCIACGHCEAICPCGAVSISGFNEEAEDINEQTRLNPDELMRAIKTRRSIRKFTEDNIPESILNSIIEAGRYSPTGANSQNVIFFVLDKNKDWFEAKAVEFFRYLKTTDDPLNSRLKHKTITDTFFFNGAPLVIAVASKMPVDGGIAAANMALMAEALGLGVLYSGFFKVCCNTCEEIKKRLDMPPGFQVATALVLGYPDVRYHRTVRRDPPKVVRF